MTAFAPMEIDHELDADKDPVLGDKASWMRSIS
jgi:hypothetical protein